jgi:hypothetical protein
VCAGRMNPWAAGAGTGTGLAGVVVVAQCSVMVARGVERGKGQAEGAKRGWGGEQGGCKGMY